MNPNALQATNFLIAASIITWRDIKHPDPKWPLGPVPPPYRYAMAALAFGLLAGVGQVFNASRLTSILGVGLVMGLAFQTFQGAAKGTTAAPANPTQPTTIQA